MRWELRVRGSKATLDDRRCLACGGPIERGERIGVLVEYLADHPKRPGWYPCSDRLHHDCATVQAEAANAEHRLASNPDA